MDSVQNWDSCNHVMRFPYKSCIKKNVPNRGWVFCSCAKVQGDRPATDRSGRRSEGLVCVTGSRWVTEFRESAWSARLKGPSYNTTASGFVRTYGRICFYWLRAPSGWRQVLWSSADFSPFPSFFSKSRVPLRGHVEPHVQILSRPSALSSGTLAHTNSLPKTLSCPILIWRRVWT
jgi:hypothetical protein